jgi:hypothetical protein
LNCGFACGRGPTANRLERFDAKLTLGTPEKVAELRVQNLRIDLELKTA